MFYCCLHVWNKDAEVLKSQGELRRNLLDYHQQRVSHGAPGNSCSICTSCHRCHKSNGSYLQHEKAAFIAWGRLASSQLINQSGVEKLYTNNDQMIHSSFSKAGISTQSSATHRAKRTTKGLQFTWKAPAANLVFPYRQVATDKNTLRDFWRHGEESCLRTSVTQTERHRKLARI